MIGKSLIAAGGDLRPFSGMTEPYNPHSLEAIGDRLRRTRIAMKMTQAAWCRRVGIEPPAWNNFEKGIRRIAPDNAYRVCAATGVDFSWIYQGISTNLPSHLAAELDKPAPDERKRRR